MRNGGLIPRNALLIYDMFKIYCLMGRHHMKDALENLFKGPIVLSDSVVEYYPISAKDQSRIHHF